MNEKTIFIAVVLLLGITIACLADDSSSHFGRETWLAGSRELAAYEEAGRPLSVTPVEGEPEVSYKSVPLYLYINYTLVSDYVFRGANLSEYAGEGREKLNHQLGVGLELDTSELGWNIGSFGFLFWGEWFEGQEMLTPTSSGTLQEVDYTIYWRYEISKIYTTLETGWTALTFPQLGGDAYYTNEWYISLSFDDSPLFSTEEPVLNPYIAYYLDTDDVDGGWLEWGISHDFPMSNMGLAGTPILKDITLTPSFVMGIDDGQYGRSMRVANLRYGLDVAYDLSGALNIPEKYGSMTITGFIYFSDAIFSEVLNDEFWGGVTFGYAW